jgi:hypothetical protein
MCCNVFCGNVVVNFSYRGYPGMLAASSHLFYLPEVGGGDGDVACREVFVDLVDASCLTVKIIRSCCNRWAEFWKFVSNGYRHLRLTLACCWIV